MGDDSELPELKSIPAKAQDGYSVLPTDYLKAFEQARQMMRDTKQKLAIPENSRDAIATLVPRDLTNLAKNNAPGFAIRADSPGLQNEYYFFIPSTAPGTTPDLTAPQSWGTENAGVNVGELLKRRDAAYKQARMVRAPDKETAAEHSVRMAEME